jgi:hypothetical protein
VKKIKQFLIPSSPAHSEKSKFSFVGFELPSVMVITEVISPIPCPTIKTP